MRCLFLPIDGWTRPLAAEIQSTFQTAAFENSPKAGPILADVANPAPEAAIAFAAQVLPNVEQVSAASIAEWGRRVGGLLLETLQPREGPWRLHVFSCSVGNKPGGGRSKLTRASILEFLKQKRRRIIRELVEEDDRPISDGELLAQLALESPTGGYLSVSPMTTGWVMRSVSRFPGGAVKVPEDRRAPSRANQKLREALLRMGHSIEPGETCVDLGASPGGWTFEAISRGARVITVDRSPLRNDLMRNDKVQFIRGDAFRYRPAEQVDWLFSDVVAFPQRILELLEKWLAERWMRKFCVTMKFRGETDYPLVNTAKKLLNDAGCSFCIRRMQTNKNEVTLYGTLNSTDFVGC